MHAAEMATAKKRQDVEVKQKMKDFAEGNGTDVEQGKREDINQQQQFIDDKLNMGSSTSNEEDEGDLSDSKSNVHLASVTGSTKSEVKFQ